MFERWRRRSEQDFRAEIEAHLALEAERQSAQRGLSGGEAREAARRAFGNVGRTREYFFDSQRWAWAERAGRNIRLALRSIRLRPGFAIAAILTLGIGIGFNTAIFTLFYSLAFRSLPVRDPAGLVNVYQRFSGEYSRSVNGNESMISYPEFASYLGVIDSSRAAGGAIVSAAVYATDRFAFTGATSDQIPGEYASCSYFDVLGVRLALGRGFVADECAHAGSPSVAVLSHAEWIREFGGDSSVVGRTVRINEQPFSIIGVAEQGFGGLSLEAAAVWVPVTMQIALANGREGRDSLLVRDWSWLTMAARLRPGAGVAGARSELAIAARRRDSLYPGRTTRVLVERGGLLNFPEARVQGAIVVALLGGLGLLVVAMVCANIMNLLLSRGIARRREIGIRLAIGASRAHLVEQLLTESAVLAALGGTLGFAIAGIGPPLLLRLMPDGGLNVDVTPDFRVLAFTALATLATALAFGLVPALQATNVDLVSASKGGGLGSRDGVRPSRLRAAIVGVQVAGSTLLLIVAALFVRAAQKGGSIDPGFATRDVIALNLNLQSLGYSADRTRQTLEALRTRIAAVPGVRALAYTAPLPLLGRRSDRVDPLDGAGDHHDVRTYSYANASGTFLATLQIPLVEGRSYTDAEIAAAAPENQPSVVNVSLAKLLWPGQSALGKRFRMEKGTGFIVVGVAADSRPVSLGETSPFLYRPAVPGLTSDLRIVVRLTGSSAAFERMVQAWARTIDPAIVVKSQRMSERFALALLPARIASGIAGAMGALALLLSIVGIYGVVSFAVSSRRRDIAVRLALGATSRGVVWEMMREGSRPVVIGVGVGTLGALAVSAGIQSVLLGTSPLDALAYAITIFVLCMASAAALYAPASRAARVSPAQTLRED